jgi:uncharacterized protein (TIGR00369 family)
MAAALPRLPAHLAADLLERLRTRFSTYPLIQGWGVAIERVEPGRAILLLGPSPLIQNLMGTVNGGVQATLADMACAVALSTAFDGTMPFATSDLHIRYLEPAVGQVHAEAEVVRISSRGAVLECRLKCGAQVVALCTTHFTIKVPRKG